MRNCLGAVLVLLVAASGIAAGGVAVGAVSPAQADCGFPVSVTDATGTSVTIEERPQRLIVLGPSAAQTVWELGAADRVVGIDRFSTYLEGADEVPIVSEGLGGVQYEAALDRDPDLIVVGGNSYPDAVAAEFRTANVTVVKLANAASLPDIYGVTNRSGRISGTCEAAERTVASMRERVSLVDRTVEIADARPTIFYPLGGGFSVGPGSFIHDVMTRAGGHNILTEGNFSAYPQVPAEFIIEEDPEWLLATYNPARGQTPDDPKSLLPRSDAINQTVAYREGRIVGVNANALNQPAPRIVEAMVTIARTLHPTAFAEANRTTTTFTSTEPTMASTSRSPTDAPTASTTTGGDGGTLPGFGLIVACLGVVLAGAVHNRR